MILSVRDLPAIRIAIDNLYRVIEHPDATNQVACNVFREWSEGVGLAEQSPAEVVSAAFILSAIDKVMKKLGHHTRDECPEITTSDLDLPTKAVLLAIRDDIRKPLLSHSLANSARARTLFLVELTGTLGKLDAPLGVTHTAPPVPPPADSPRRKLGKPAREQLIADAIAKRLAPAGKNADHLQALAETVTLDDIAEDTDVRRSTVGDSTAWKVFHAERSNRAAKKPTPKAHRPLTAKMLAVLPDPSASTSHDRLADRDDVEARYRAACSPAELDRLAAMTRAERREMLDLLAGQIDDAD